VMADLIAGRQSYRTLKWRLLRTFEWRLAINTALLAGVGRLRSQARISG